MTQPSDVEIGIVLADMAESLLHDPKLTPAQAATAAGFALGCAYARGKASLDAVTKEMDDMCAEIDGTPESETEL